MGTLHGILAELGLDSPDMHPERDASREPGWIADQDFTPVVGETYNVAYGQVRLRGEDRYVVKTVRIDGSAPSQWYDLDEDRPLDAELFDCPVKAFRKMS